MKTIKCKRSKLAEILDHIRCDLADRVPPEEIERKLALINKTSDGHVFSGAYNISNAPQIEPLEICEHEPHTDNCMSCAPRWGHRGAKVVPT